MESRRAKGVSYVAVNNIEGYVKHNYFDKDQHGAYAQKQTIVRYQAANCEGCPLRGAGHKSKTNRTIEVNHILNEHKGKATERLTSEKGIYYRKRRPVDVESVFGNIKSNHGFRRFMLRGKETYMILVSQIRMKICDICSNDLYGRGAN